MEKRRVVITGLGTVNPLGNTAADSWAAAKAGRCGIGPITQFDTTDFKCKLAGEVKNFDPETVVDKKEARKMARFTLPGTGCCSRGHCRQRPEHGSRGQKHRCGPFQRHWRPAHHRGAAHPRGRERHGEGQPLLCAYVHCQHGGGTGGHPLWPEGHVYLPGHGLRRRHKRCGRCFPPHPGRLRDCHGLRRCRKLHQPLGIGGFTSMKRFPPPPTGCCQPAL